LFFTIILESDYGFRISEAGAKPKNRRNNRKYLWLWVSKMTTLKPNDLIQSLKISPEATGVRLSQDACAYANRLVSKGSIDRVLPQMNL